MKLDKQIDKLIEYCENLNIHILSIDSDDFDFSNLLNLRNGLDELFRIIKASESKIVYLNRIYCEFSKDDLDFDPNKIFDKENKKLAIVSIKGLQKLNKSLLAYEVLVNNENVILKYFAATDNYYRAAELMHNLKEVRDRKRDDRIYRSMAVRDHNRKFLRPLAIELSKHERFQELFEADTGMMELVKLVLGERMWKIEEIDYEENESYRIYSEIIEIAKDYFKVYLEPQIDRKRIEQISKWKDQKMSKREMAGRLEISERKLGLYYYKT